MKALQSFGRFLFFLIVLLAVTGGVLIRKNGMAVEISQLDVFGALLLLILVATSLYRRTWNLTGEGPLEKTIFKFLAWTSDEALAPGRLIKFFLFFFGALLLGHWVRHAIFETNIYDMNCLHQPLAFPFGMELFHCDICRMQTQFAEHMVWSLVPLSLLTQWLRSDVFIFVVQSLVVAVPFWFFIRRGPLENQKSLWIPFFILCALFQPWRNGLIFDFREDEVGFGFLLLSFVAFWKRRWIWGIAFATVVMLSKENFPAVTAVYGVILFFDRSFPLSAKERRYSALALVALSAIVFMVYVKWLIPYFMGPSEGRNNILVLYPGMGSTMGEFVINVLKHPIQFLSLSGPRLFTAASFRYVLYFAMPFFFWGRRAWIWWLPGLLTVALNLLTANSNQISGSYHYEMVAMPFFILAAALGLRARMPAAGFMSMRSSWTWALVLAVCVAGRGPLFEVTNRLMYKWELIPVHFAVLGWNVEAPLGASAFTLPHFNHVSQQRHFRGFNPSGDRLQDLKVLANSNTRSGVTDQGRSLRDAKDFVLDLRDPDQKFFAEELARIGAQRMNVAKDARGNEVFVHLRSTRSPFEIWCEIEKICPEP